MSTGTAFPLARRIALTDPLAAYHALAKLPDPFLLHSTLAGPHARWSFFGADPFSTYRGGDYAGGVAAFRRLARRVAADPRGDSRAPFTGGAVGYWSYDFGRRLERVHPAGDAPAALDDLGLPDFLFGFYDVVGAIDHVAGETWLFSSGLPLDGDRRLAHAGRRLERFVWLLDRAEAPAESAPATLPGGIAVSNFHPDRYRQTIERVREHIRRGDLFQANLSQRWTLPCESSEPNQRAFELHRAAAQVSPAPFAALLGCGDHAVVSASPERFLERRGDRVVTRPIKGTRPRGADPADDARLAAELLASAKDRAENVMIVDVMRNDLGRVCEPGSIEAPELCALEKFPQVFHLTSTVTGRLSPGRDAFDLLHACFPGGSITGAPKIRAMEILDGLEPHRRHLYTGSVGYIDWQGDADWNIAIRTALVTRDAIHFAAGGGITADSDAELETEETRHKAEGLRAALSRVLGPVEFEPGGVLAE